MGNAEPQGPKSANSIKVPLGFSVALGAVAGLVTLVVSAGGTIHGLRWDLGAIAFGIAFIASLLVASLLVMGHKENPDYLSEGSGVNRKSSDRLAAARKAAEDAAAVKAAAEKDAAKPDDGETSAP
jgi:high-affinity Fe2+/Pb2+ permease